MSDPEVVAPRDPIARLQRRMDEWDSDDMPPEVTDKLVRDVWAALLADDLIARLDTMLRDLREARTRQEWRPIETAPKDGTRLCYFEGGWQSIVDLRTLPLMTPAPTHWMPLPDPPARLAGETP